MSEQSQISGKKPSVVKKKKVFDPVKEIKKKIEEYNKEKEQYRSGENLGRLYHILNAKAEGLREALKIIKG